MEKTIRKVSKSALMEVLRASPSKFFEFDVMSHGTYGTLLLTEQNDGYTTTHPVLLSYEAIKEEKKEDKK